MDAQGVPVIMWNGLHIRLHYLDSPFSKFVKLRGNHGTYYLRNSAVGQYWIAEVPVDDALVYLVLRDRTPPEDAKLDLSAYERGMREVLHDRQRLRSHIMYIVYNGEVHHWNTPSARTILEAVEQAISPGVFALMGSQNPAPI